MLYKEANYQVSGIYQIKNLVNSKVYIGSSYCIKRRLQMHISRLNRGVHHSPYLQASFVKYGSDSFEVSLLEEVCKEELLKKEQYYLDLFQAYSRETGYNVSSVAGNTAGRLASNDTKKKLSLRKIGKGKNTISNTALKTAYTASEWPYIDMSMVEVYMKEGKSLEQIGQILGCSQTTVSKYLSTRNISSIRTFTKEEVIEAVRLYENNLNYSQISRSMDKPLNNVVRLLTRQTKRLNKFLPVEFKIKQKRTKK